MNHLVARSVMKRVIGGGRYVSSYASPAGIRALTPFDASVAAVAQKQGLSMVLIQWGRMMSTASEPSPTPTVVEKEKKSDGVATGNVGKGEMVVSSYWGVSRPRITREDGTEWPWNCFMVTSSSIRLPVEFIYILSVY